MPPKTAYEPWITAPLTPYDHDARDFTGHWYCIQCCKYYGGLVDVCEDELCREYNKKLCFGGMCNKCCGMYTRDEWHLKCDPAEQSSSEEDDECGDPECNEVMEDYDSDNICVKCGVAHCNGCIRDTPRGKMCRLCKEIAEAKPSAPATAAAAPAGSA